MSSESNTVIGIGGEKIRPGQIMAERFECDGLGTGPDKLVPDVDQAPQKVWRDNPAGRHPVCPGEMLQSFADDHNLDITRVARSIGLSDADTQRLYDGLLELTEDVAVGMTGLTGVSVGMWMRLEAQYRTAI